MSALRTYARFIPRFKKVAEEQNWALKSGDDWMNDEQLWSKLVNYYLNLDVSSETIRSYLNAIRQVARHYGLTSENPIDQTISTHTLQLTRMFRAREEQNQPEYRDGHVFTLEELNQIMDCLTTEIKSPVQIYRRNGKDILKLRARYQTHQQRIILGMYLYHPVIRQNYGHVQLWGHDKSENYIEMDDSKVAFVHIGHDKVSSVYGPFEFPLDGRILTFLTELREMFPMDPKREWLLTLRDDRTLPLNSSVDCSKTDGSRELLSSIPLVNGSRSELSVCKLRVTAASAFYSVSHSIEEEEAMAKSMRTSVSVLRKSYHKLDRPSNPVPESLDSLLHKRKLNC